MYNYTVHLMYFQGLYGYGRSSHIPEVREWRAELKKGGFVLSMSKPRPSHKLPCALLWQSFKDGGIA